MSFYRKYRPQKLAEIVGQEHVRKTFLNALSRGGLTHAYLFAGTRGTGKTSTARIIARALNCLKPAAGGEPCNECDICAEALQGRLVDLIEIDAASNRGIDEIRDLKEKIAFSPSRAKTKIYIIDEVHMLTKEAFNALLKTLEEPPEHAYFILATTEPHRVPETILSRTQRFDFHRIETTAIAQHLATIAEREGIKFEPEALTLIAKQSAGGMRDALGMLEQLGAGGEITAAAVAENLGLTRPAAVEDFVFAILFQKLTTALETIAGLVAEGANLIQFSKAVLARLRELMLEKVAQNRLAEAKKILVIIEEFTRAGEELKSAVIPQLPLEVAAISVCGDAEITEAVPQKVAANSPPAEKEKPPKKVETEKEPPKVDKKTSSPPAVNGELSLAAAKAVLPKVVGQIKKPAVKLALRECTVLSAENGEVVLGAGSDFLIERLDNSALRGELATLFSEALGSPVRVKIERTEIELASSAPEPRLVPKKSAAEVAEELFSEGW